MDHLLVSPTGAVYLPDTKRWSAAHPVRIRAGRLLHGQQDVTARLDGLRHETATVARVLGVPVTPRGHGRPHPPRPPRPPRLPAGAPRRPHHPPATSPTTSADRPASPASAALRRGGRRERHLPVHPPPPHPLTQEGTPPHAQPPPRD
ncbi:hypothetical protein E4N64_14405 [Streptomyces sp. MNU103]|nr:hypothetical protein [Streptomyces sp. MNU103]